MPRISEDALGGLALHYTVYENRPNNRATVHRATCGYLEMHGGVSSTTPPLANITRGLRRRKLP